MAASAIAAPRDQAGGNPAPECRVWERYSCSIQSTIQPISARREKECTWPAQVRDLSPGGIGLVLDRRFEPGAGLAVELPSEDPDDIVPFLAKVVHVQPLADGMWFLGCSFVSELSEDELLHLLEFADRAQVDGIDKLDIEFLPPPRGRRYR